MCPPPPFPLLQGLLSCKRASQYGQVITKEHLDARGPLDITRPFRRDSPGPARSPNAAYAASVKQLKRLVFDYCARHETSMYSIL
ncbi:unnamed protein product [Clonostachys chloroleuca]|uniref:Uncharacterized protein n=1 Tax=Clonostachys chloroleuca TaxID=1926264 RepID=A0AA35M891_9HYPO|nr:unnamed protein product [Clonostachys chloroleuca]